MTRKSVYLSAAIVALSAVTIFAQDKPVQGTMTLNKKTWQLSQGLAYEGKENGEEVNIVIVSNQPITAKKLKEGRSKEAHGAAPGFNPTYLRLAFKKSGELIQWNGVDPNTSVSGVTDEGCKTELKLENGRAIGSATQPLNPSDMIPRALDLKFNVPMMKANEELPASAEPEKKRGGPAANVKPTVSGTFMGNGKEGKLSYVSARWTEPFDNKPGILLVFTEKDHSQNKKPDNEAMFGRYGNALIISLHEDGSIYSCQVVHNAMKHKGFSSTGSIEATPFTYENGKVEGEITTNGPVDTSDEKWEVKLKFTAPLGEIPKEYQVREEKPAAAPAKESNREEAETASAMAKPPAAAGPKAKELALAKDASEVEYTAMVGSIEFKSNLDVKAACADLSANLNKQGWAKKRDDLITPASSIMHRNQGAATLTIFVKPNGTGSKINMMTEGLDWEGEGR